MKKDALPGIDCQPVVGLLGDFAFEVEIVALVLGATDS
jgi:hypothetical protein